MTVKNLLMSALTCGFLGSHSSCSFTSCSSFSSVYGSFFKFLGSRPGRSRCRTLNDGRSIGIGRPFEDGTNGTCSGTGRTVTRRASRSEGST